MVYAIIIGPLQNVINYVANLCGGKFLPLALGILYGILCRLETEVLYINSQTHT